MADCGLTAAKRRITIMTAENVKCFHGNLDGLRQGLVVARSQKQVAEIAKIPLHSFRDYWSSGSFPKEWNPKPYVLYSRRYATPNASYVEGLCSLDK